MNKIRLVVNNESKRNETKCKETNRNQMIQEQTDQQVIAQWGEERLHQ